ncbi:hypothetical protein M23134_02659 [Microscilla marina ATCC 23134]|uniref:Uncharacterized protein n=2 Tax=Microscilla marina TaxID=1027 RepID=A1ZNV1_MICM2|nr:hypothetical protein M23134_02659 [Microscilla marina ATCC 23134]
MLGGIFCLSSCSNANKPLNPAREQKILETLQQRSHWWHQEHKWFVNNLKQHPNHPAKAQLPAIEKLLNHTHELVEYIERVKADLVRVIGKNKHPETGLPVHLNKKPEVGRFFKYFESEFHANYSLYYTQLNQQLTVARKPTVANRFGGANGLDNYEAAFGDTALIEALQTLVLLQIKAFEDARLLWKDAGFDHRNFEPAL